MEAAIRGCSIGSHDRHVMATHASATHIYVHGINTVTCVQ